MSLPVTTWPAPYRPFGPGDLVELQHAHDIGASKVMGFGEMRLYDAERPGRVQVVDTAPAYEGNRRARRAQIAKARRTR